MLVVTLAIAVSLTITTAYIIFNPISEDTLKTFEYLDFVFVTLAIAVITCILLVAEMVPYPV